MKTVKTGEHNFYFMEEFDLIVIGSGSGLDVASAMASRGNKVAVVEPGRLGGTCLNRGCIPSKMLIHRADIIREIEGSERFGIDASVNNIDFERIIEEVNSEVHGSSESIEKSLENSENHTLYREEARFVDEKKIELKETRRQIKAEKIVVAAGSRPFIPPIEGVEDTEFWVSTDALNPDYRPESIIMVGGGYISMELAHFYGSMGAQVTILERGDQLLKREDKNISQKITELAEARYNVELGLSASKIMEREGKKVVKAEKNGEEVEFVADEILMAAGRVPNSDTMEVENAGIETTDRGFVKTNEEMETTVEGVYALGDIADNWMFKHSANHEAQIVFRNLISQGHRLDYPAMPHAVFTSPQIAGVGKTEQQLEEEDKHYVSASYDYEDTGMGGALKEEDGFVKVLASEEGKILGCHIIGPEASILLHEVLVAMNAGSGNVSDIRNTVHIHPALNEVVQRAFNQIR